MKDEDDSGDEAEARHLLEKRREQAKYDVARAGAAPELRPPGVALTDDAPGEETLSGT